MLNIYLACKLEIGSNQFDVVWSFLWLFPNLSANCSARVAEAGQMQEGQTKHLMQLMHPNAPVTRKMNQDGDYLYLVRIRPPLLLARREEC